MDRNVETPILSYYSSSTKTITWTIQMNTGFLSISAVKFKVDDSLIYVAYNLIDST